MFFFFFVVVEISFDIEGMSCVFCVMCVEKVFKKILGVIDVSVNFVIECVSIVMV